MFKAQILKAFRLVQKLYIDNYSRVQYNIYLEFFLVQLGP